MALVIDTGPLYAAIDANEPAHAAAVSLFRTVSEQRVIPAPVLPELDHLCSRGGSPDRFRVFLEDVRLGAYDVVDLTASDYARVSEILETYADLRIGFVDAAVLGIVERLRETKLATLDRRHFDAMRPSHVESLELLPA